MRYAAAAALFVVTMGAATAGADVGVLVGGGSMIVPDPGYDPFSHDDNFGIGMFSIRAAPFRKGPLRGLAFELEYSGGTASDRVWGRFDTDLSLDLLSFGPSYRVEVADWFVPYCRVVFGAVWAAVEIKGATGDTMEDSDAAFGGTVAVGFQLLTPRGWLHPDTGRKDGWYKPDNFGVFVEAGYAVYDTLVFGGANVPEIENQDPNKPPYEPIGPTLGSLPLSGPAIKAGFVVNF